MSYPVTGNEVYVSFIMRNSMLAGIGKGTITRENVSADYLKSLFAKHGVIVSATPSQGKLLKKVNDFYGLDLEIPETYNRFQLSEKNRRLVIIVVNGLRRVNGALAEDYTDEEIEEATFSFIKYYVQTRHYDELVAEIERLKKDLETEIDWHNRDIDI